MWGFNIYGQLGTGDKKTKWFPTKVTHEDSGMELQRLVKIQCSSNSTFAIDEFGNPYSWGKGFIGHEGHSVQDTPKRIQ